MSDGPLATPRWARLARLARLDRRAATPTPASGPEPPREDATERCELCGQPLPERHRHLYDLESASLLCACQACSTLMDHRAAGGSHYRLVPRETRRIVDLALPEHRWRALGVPVELAFFVESTPRGGPTAFFPGALGVTEARPDAAAWGTLVAENPVLEALEPDVEALLVRRVDGDGRTDRADPTSASRQGYAAPIDACFRLTGRIRSRWRGLAGGSEVREAIEEFFAELDREAVAVDRHGRRPAAVSHPLPLEVTP